MQRIEAFLKEDEVPDWASSLKREAVEGKPLPSTSSQPPRLGPGISEPTKGEARVGFEKAIFAWSVVPRGRQDTPFKLGPLNLTFPIGKLSLVSGATGSGKTALLLSLLGGKFSESLSGLALFERFSVLEMTCVDGKVSLDKSGGNVAYCAQTPCRSVEMSKYWID